LTFAHAPDEDGDGSEDGSDHGGEGGYVHGATAEDGLWGSL
jgi:hypothetical protein